MGHERPRVLGPTLSCVVVVSTRPKRTSESGANGAGRAYGEPLWFPGLLRNEHKILHYRANWDTLTYDIWWMIVQWELQKQLRPFPGFDILGNDSDRDTVRIS